MWRSEEEAIRMLDRLQCAEAFRQWVEAFYDYRLGVLFQVMKGQDPDDHLEDMQEMNLAWDRVTKLIRTQSESPTEIKDEPANPRECDGDFWRRVMTDQ